MGLNEVVQEIINSAQKEVASIDKQTKEEVAAILARAKTQINEQEQSAAQDLARVKESVERKVLSSANLESKKALQNAKKVLLEQVYSSTQTAVEKMDAKKREMLLRKIALSAKDDIGEVATVYVNKKDAKIAQSLFSGAIVKETTILGGAILENKDGTVRVDKSFDQMLIAVQEKKLKDVSEILFGKAK